MTRHRGFDVWVAPNVTEVIRDMAGQPGTVADDARRIRAAQRRLAISGTRAVGARKLRSLDLWEIRAGRYRLFFCPVPGRAQITVGALVLKTSRRLRSAKLQSIERMVHRWRDEVEEMR